MPLCSKPDRWVDNRVVEGTRSRGRDGRDKD